MLYTVMFSCHDIGTWCDPTCPVVESKSNPFSCNDLGNDDGGNVRQCFRAELSPVFHSIILSLSNDNFGA